VHTRRPKPCRLTTSPLLQQIVASKLALEWSPAQVAGWLKLEFPDQDTMRVSHETIYRSLFIQARGVLKKELIGHLRSRRRMRRAQGGARQGNRAGRLWMVSLSATGPLTWTIERFPVIGKGI
jgi:IS30 family transposase